MKITAINLQTRNDNRVNVSVDGRFEFSLDLFQITELGLKIGSELDDEKLTLLKQESGFGLAYAKAVKYCLMRPHSKKEIHDYLIRKTFDRKDYSADKDGPNKVMAGMAPELAERVFARLIDKGYVDDYKFALFWAQNRSIRKGISRQKLIFELRSKGVEDVIIKQALNETLRHEDNELKKMIQRKQSKYDDPRKLIEYLRRQGFKYDDIKTALSDDSDPS